MRVAIVSPYSWSVPGGVNTHVSDLADHLRRRGHEVRILGVSEGAAPAGVVRVGRTTPIPINSGVARVAVSPTIASRVRVSLRRAQPDVIHIHEPFVSTVTVAAVLASKAPLVATFHSGAETGAYQALRAALRPLWERIDTKIAVSNAARGLVEEAFGPGARIVPNGVDTEVFSAVPPEPPDPSVLFFGRLEKRKGAQTVARAWPAVASALPEARLTLAGDGALREELEEALGEHRVSFPGPFDRTGLLQHLGNHQVACLPAIGGESFGITLVEAMAAKRAVVATAVAGYTSVIRHDPEGLLVPPDDPQALATALISVLSDDARRRELAEGGFQRAQRFGWTRVTSEIEEAYADAVRRAERVG
ncbi:MAG: glycosyltransferase family 4 protein [Actinomycetota bacterium]